jgi:hypothetical protein
MVFVAEGLLVGQALELLVDGDPGPACAAFVFGTTAREILLTLGHGQKAPAHLVAGAWVTLRFSTTMGLHEARTRVLTVAHDRTVKLGIAQVDRPTIVQRRLYFRVAAALAAQVTVAESASADRVGAKDPKAVTRDISAGGVCLETSLSVSLWDVLAISLETPRAFRKSLPAELACTGRVLRIQETTRSGRTLYLVGVEMVIVAERDRDRWVQLTFDLQRGVQL